jgi:hypothetical protein
MRDLVVMFRNLLTACYGFQPNPYRAWSFPALTKFLPQAPSGTPLTDRPGYRYPAGDRDKQTIRREALHGGERDR